MFPIKIFPYDPILFSLDFVRKMRADQRIKSKPSVRQSISIGKMIIARFLRRLYLTKEDIVLCAVATTPLEDRDIAREIALRILYREEKQAMFNQQKTIQEINLLEDIGNLKDYDLENSAQEDIDELEQIVQELSFLKQSYDNLSKSDIENIENFYEYLESHRYEEPVKSYLEYMGGLDKISEQGIKSMQELTNFLKSEIQKQHNNLNPSLMKIAEAFDMLDDLFESSLNQIEKFIIALKQDHDFPDVFIDIMQENLKNLIDTIQAARNYDMLESSKLDEYEKFVSQQLPEHDLNMYRDAVMAFGAKMRELEQSLDDIQKMLQNSIQNMNYDELSDTAEFLDSHFGTNFEEALNDLLSNMLSEFPMDEPPQDSMEGGQLDLSHFTNMPIEDLLKNPRKSTFWRQMVSKQIQKNLEDIKKNTAGAGQNAETLYNNLIDQVNQNRLGSENVAASHYLQHAQDAMLKKMMQDISHKDTLINMLQHATNQNIDIDYDEAINRGRQLQVADETVAQILKPTFELIKKMIESNQNNFDQYLKMMKKIDLKDRQTQELANMAVEHNVKNALAALANINLSQTLNSIENQMGDDELRDMISSLGAGAGEQLLKAWFYSRDGLSPKMRLMLKEYLKKIMVELAIKYSNTYVGSAESGPIEQTEVRTYTDDDDFELIDLDESVTNLLEQGKKVKYVDNDDFLVAVTKQGLRSIVMEMDCSGSMAGGNLGYMGICALMLLYKFDVQELAICFFESNLYILKNLDEEVELDKIADKILDLRPMGGTMMSRALEWANLNLQKKYSQQKMNIIFTDAEVYDFDMCEVEFKKMAGDDVKCVLVVPKNNYSGTITNRFQRITNGSVLRLTDWQDFPELISKIFT